jgi:hypothetical protein
MTSGPLTKGKIMSHHTDTTTKTAADGVVRGAPHLLLRVEGAAALIAAVTAYAALGGGAWTFAALILLPDLSMLGYLVNPRLGAVLYNLVHATPGALAVIAVGWWLSALPVALVGLIWLAHIGMDRMAGYGLKYPDAFRHTHLG